MQHGEFRARRGRISAAVLALACASGLALTACGSEEKSESTGGAASATGTVEQATGAPIKVGYFSLDQGAGTIPEAGPAGAAAVKRINEGMGGINGRPIDLVVCHVDASPEKNIGCANQFVQERVAVVIDGFDFASGAALPILHEAKIPVVGPAAFAPQAEGDPASYYFGLSQGALGIAPLLSFKEQGLKDVTFAAGDIPAARGYVDGFIAPAAKNLGLTFSAVYYPVASANFQSIASSIAATKPQVGGLPGSGDEGQCTALVEGLRSVGYENSIFTGFCSQFIEAVGAQKAGDAQMYSTVWLPQMKQYAPPEVQEQLEMAESDLEAVGDPAKQGYFSYGAYAAVMTLGDVLRSIDGPIDSKTATRALKDVKDLQSFLGPKITCDHSKWPKSSTCSNEVIMATLQPDGSLKPNDEGGFFAVSPSVLPKTG